MRAKGGLDPAEWDFSSVPMAELPAGFPTGGRLNTQIPEIPEIPEMLKVDGSARSALRFLRFLL